MELPYNLGKSTGVTSQFQEGMSDDLSLLVYNVSGTFPVDNSSRATKFLFLDEGVKFESGKLAGTWVVGFQRR